MHKRIAIIGGTSFEKLIETASRHSLTTPYGTSQPIHSTQIGDVPVRFMPRHGLERETPPHRVNYRANIWALKKMGIERILATNAVGAINPHFAPRDLVVPHDIIDLTRGRRSTFYDEPPLHHIDVSEPYCPELRDILAKAGKSTRHKQWSGGVYVCTDGPRFETPAEIKAIARMEGDLVGMTGATEAFLARELEICYASLCYVSNMAAGLQSRLTSKEVTKVGGEVELDVFNTLEEAVRLIPKERSCQCKFALKDARM